MSAANCQGSSAFDVRSLVSFPLAVSAIPALQAEWDVDDCLLVGVRRCTSCIGLPVIALIRAGSF